MARCVTFIRSAWSSSPIHYDPGWLSTMVRVWFTQEQKWSIPLEQGFLSVFSSKPCGFILTLLDWLIKTYWWWDSKKWRRNATWIGSEFPFMKDGHRFLKEGDGGWESFSILGHSQTSILHLPTILNECCYKRKANKSKFKCYSGQPDIIWNKINRIF